MKKWKCRSVTRIFQVVFFFFALCFASLSVKAAGGSDEVIHARPSVSGPLCVKGVDLCDHKGNPVVLRGISSHGLTYFPEYINKDLISQLSNEWDANLFRLAMYSGEYHNGKKEQSKKLVEDGIKYATEADMYVIVDWHVLEDANPLKYLGEAVDFFNEISLKYRYNDNIIYEICNEPNGDTTWEDICQYAECVIPTIRNNDPDAVIIVGTPDYCRQLTPTIYNPIPNGKNIMYDCHFYSSTHKERNLSEVKRARAYGIPVIFAECGLSEHTGDGVINPDGIDLWFSYIEENHMSYVLWNLSNKSETSSIIKYNVTKTKNITDSDLSAYGQYVKALVQGKPVAEILGKTNKDYSSVEQFFLLWKTPVDQLLVILEIVAAELLLFFIIKFLVKKNRVKTTYYDLLKKTGTGNLQSKTSTFARFILLASIFTSLIYLTWRFLFSVPLLYGPLAILINVLLLIVEIVGFVESTILFAGLVQMKNYPFPEIADEEFPDVDIFISTYNEPVELLHKTILGCKNLQYPDQSKVHIYLCDDNRRPAMHELADRLQVNYFDRPNNEGQKAGNLNHALENTSSPYVVTLDADMIPKSDFLLKTIPYYVDAKKRNETLPEAERIPLGLIQTPQCFYNPDVFQHDLYCEYRIPNEQDFFYRTIEVAKTETNSVIYGGSNTILSREALVSIGGFYTKTITEDFATGMLIESAGYASLGLGEPLASGLAPTSFKEHRQQRTRWGRGVIRSAKQLKLLNRKELTIDQKLSYLSSVLYWYSPIKQLVYFISLLGFAVFSIPVFRCSTTELLMFWLPMFILQSVCLRHISKGSISTKWGGVQEISIMPFLLIPTIKEMCGITLSKFMVTNKSGKQARDRDRKSLIPFLVMIAIGTFGAVRVGYLFIDTYVPGYLVLFYWLLRYLYFLVMGCFLVDGRERDGESVHVIDALPVFINSAGNELFGITTRLTEHSVQIYLDEENVLRLGEHLDFTIEGNEEGMNFKGTVVSIKESKSKKSLPLYSVEILDFADKRDAYLMLLYDRVPTLPQTLSKDMGFLKDLWLNVTKRLGS